MLIFIEIVSNKIKEKKKHYGNIFLNFYKDINFFFLKKNHNKLTKITIFKDLN